MRVSREFSFLNLTAAGPAFFASFSHAATLASTGPQDFIHVHTRAHEAELCSRIHGALKELERDPAEFIKTHLSRERA